MTEHQKQLDLLVEAWLSMRKRRHLSGFWHYIANGDRVACAIRDHLLERGIIDDKGHVISEVVRDGLVTKQISLAGGEE